MNRVDLPDWVQGNFRALLDAVPDAILVVNDAGKIVIANAQVETLFCYTRDQLLGVPINSLVPERHRERHLKHREDFFRDPHMRGMGVGLELYALKSDGSEFPVEISLSPLATGSGTFVISIIRDITDRKQIEAEVRVLNEELQTRVAELAASNRELEAFSYSVSHDLRAPLRQIDGFSKILLEEGHDSLSSELRQCIQHIRQGTLSMGRLVDDLLNFSRLGRQPLQRHIVDMHKLVQALIAETQEEIQTRQIQWRVHPLSNVECDPVLIKQVFLNLISNAIKFTRPRSPAVIEIGQDCKDEQTIFWMKDNGVGFNMKYADKLFGVFQRLHLQDDFEGTGVGLASVQRIVHKHGGHIWVDAEVDRGATFFFTLVPAGDNHHG